MSISILQHLNTFLPLLALAGPTQRHQHYQRFSAVKAQTEQIEAGPEAMLFTADQAEIFETSVRAPPCARSSPISSWCRKAPIPLC